MLVGVGALPNVELADAAGIGTGDGILVDEYGRTSAPDVCALGDVAAQLHHGARVRVEHHDNALRQGMTVAANLTGAARCRTPTRTGSGPTSTTTSSSPSATRATWTISCPRARWRSYGSPRSP